MILQHGLRGWLEAGGRERLTTGSGRDLGRKVGQGIIPMNRGSTALQGGQFAPSGFLARRAGAGIYVLAGAVFVRGYPAAISRSSSDI